MAKKKKYAKGEKCGIDKSIEDIKAGRVTIYKSSTELFKNIGI